MVPDSGLMMVDWSFILVLIYVGSYIPSQEVEENPLALTHMWAASTFLAWCSRPRHFSRLYLSSRRKSPRMYATSVFHARLIRPRSSSSPGDGEELVLLRQTDNGQDLIGERSEY
jgi:hypothetical protein